MAPLFWGLGHSSRCIPIINQLLDQGNTVAIASDGEALSLLRMELPDLESFELPEYDINYKYQSMIINMAVQGPKVLSAIKKEKTVAQQIASSWNADILISDNRLGFRSNTTKNIYISHQLNIPHPNKIVSAIANRLHHDFINKYDECWIPDYEGERSLAGKMTQAELKIAKHFIGVQSRLVKKDLEQDIDLAIILSGPEPQRTYLEERLLEKIAPLAEKSIYLIRGTEKAINLAQYQNLTVYNLLASAELNDIINRSKQVVCRAGYSSIMDLVALGKGATLIPTPGQYEQEYLGETLNGKHGFRYMGQDSIELLDY
ncbi:MAG: hypothetical protein ACJA1A_000174 [Saprospiraceae bacterium]